MNHIKEETFIRQCMNLDHEPASIKNLDWDYIFKKTKESCTSPIVYSRLKLLPKYLLPQAVLNSFKNTYLMTALRNEQFLAELGKILQITQKENIPILLLKGIALINTTYKDAGLRPMVDMDILIPKQHLQRFEQIIFSLGYSPINYGPFIYVKNNHFPIMLDVHTDIWYLKSLGEIYKTASRIKVNSRQAMVMHPEDALIYLAAHSALYHGHIQVLHLIDINETINAYSSQINWQRLVEKIIKYNIDVPVYYVFKQMKTNLKTDMPDFVLDRINPKDKKKFQKWLYELILNSKALPNAGYILHLFIFPGLHSKIRFIVSFIFPPKEFMLRRYKIKVKSLVYFYYPYRMISHIKKIIHFARRLFISGILRKGA